MQNKILFKLWIGLILFSISSLVNCLGQTVRDSTYFESFVDKLNVKINLDTSTSEFIVFDDNGADLVLDANNALRLDISVDYEFIGLTIGFAPSFFNDNTDDDRKGKSTFTEYGFRFIFNQWIQELQYRNVRGFYVKNTGDFIAGWDNDTDPFLQFPDLKTIVYGGATSYILNPNFSLRNVAYNTEWQLKSAGSFVPSLDYYYNRLSFRDQGVKEFENNFGLGILAAYYYTWVIHKNWFIAPRISPGIGIRFTNSGREGSSVRSRETSYPLLLNGALQLGYSSERIIFGGLINFRSTYLQADGGSSVLEDQAFAKIYLGYRFDPPGFIDRSMKKINKKLGL